MVLYTKLLVNTQHLNNNYFGTALGQTHYDKTPMQYTAIFHCCKNANFQMKNFDNFLLFAQNIDRWYTFESPH